MTISTKKHNRASVNWYNDSSGQWRKYNKNLDFRGILRKSFFVVSNECDILKYDEHR